MVGLVELQSALGAPMTVVISDLGAWNSRNVPWEELCHYRDRMARFLVALGFDLSAGRIRTHLDPPNLVRAGRIARYLTFSDFDEHQEEFLELYGAHGLLGSRVGVLVDALYTVADILQPFDEGCGTVLMVSGIEEAYFTRLAQRVLQRQASSNLGLGWEGEIGALYFRVVRGLAGYPKMSKSIPQSAIHVGLPETELADRILSGRESDQAALLDAIELASGWPAGERAEARAAFEGLPASAGQWRAIRERYLATFAGFARMWQETARG